MSGFSPPLWITEIGDRVRLGIAGFGYAEGQTLQEAADGLVSKMLTIALALRAGGMGSFTSACPPDAAQLEFLWELGELAAAGGDLRERLLGPSVHAA
jgi:hypothetical protein